jgi:hypothetical protein
MSTDTKTESCGYRFDHFSDDDLHTSTRRLVGRSNQLLAALLAHLAEVDARGIHRERACASLYTYCIYELRMSEDAAFRRARAAKIARQFPIVFEQVAAGELHLTGILMLGPHLTEANHREVLALAKHRTKKEIEQLVRMLDPLPDIPALVEPLGPPMRPVVAKPSWNQVMHAHAPLVRELLPGARPRDWADGSVAAAEGSVAAAAGDSLVDARVGVASDVFSATDNDTRSDAASRVTQSQDLVAQRYKVQFTATQEYVELLQTAKDLLAHSIPNRSIEEVHLRAMRALVADLKRRKKGAVNDSRVHAFKSDPRQRGASAHSASRRDGAEVSASPSDGTRLSKSDPRQRGRYIPRAVRCAVWERDGERCTYVDAMGRRCREMGALELDHVQPHARGGTASVENLRLRCRAHNALTAEQEFGRDFVKRQRDLASIELGLR